MVQRLWLAVIRSLPADPFEAFCPTSALGHDRLVQSPLSAINLSVGDSIP
jgi:hypothetical protein